MNFRRHIRGEALPLFSMAPMLLNVALLLLCLLLGAGMWKPAACETGSRLPAVAGQPVEHVPGELVVGIASNGVLTVNRQTLTIDELRARLRQLSFDVPESVVLVQADRQTPFAHVLDVLDACRSAEIDTYRFVAAPDDSEGTPSSRVAP